MKTLKILLVAIITVVLSSVAFAVQCSIHFDASCPNVIPECGATFTGGLGCVVEGLGSCYDAGVRSYKLDANNSLQINFSVGIHALEVFFSGFEASSGTMHFINGSGEVTNTLSSNGDCDLSMPSTQSLRFNSVVNQINVTGNGTLYIDTMRTNPNSVCTSSDTVCDGVDNDCDGAVDEDANATCNNGLFCDGVELCMAGSCQAGTAIDCSANDIAAVNSCTNSPDDNSLTLDIRSSFTSTCNEATNSCAIGNSTVEHACSLVCGASCASNSDCASGYVCNLNSCGCEKDPFSWPTVLIDSPANNSLYTSRNVTLDFSVINWSVNGKNDTHIHFHIDGVSGLSFSDHVMFYNGLDNIVELNLVPGSTSFATRIDSDTIQFNNVPDGQHIIRAHLADQNHAIPSNPEADTFIVVNVNASKCNSNGECEDNSICTADFCGVNNTCQHTNIQLGVLSCGVGACYREINQCINGVEQTCTPGTPTAEVCDGIDNNCNGQVDENAACNITLTINKPVPGIYSERRIQFDLETNMEVDRISMIDQSTVRPRERTLCRNCDEYGQSRNRFISFREGQRDITIKATKDGHTVYENVTLTIDSIKPRISRTEPRRGFATGMFVVQFRETSPKELILYYGNDTELHASELNLSECYEVRRGTTECMHQVDVSGFHNGKLKYWFNISDVSEQHATSRMTELSVDMVAPVITNANATVDGRRVTFNITTDEKATLSMIDYSDRRPRFRSICRNCDSYERTRSFRSGLHNVTVKATDAAGNEDTVDFSFVV